MTHEHSRARDCIGIDHSIVAGVDKARCVLSIEGRAAAMMSVRHLVMRLEAWMSQANCEMAIGKTGRKAGKEANMRNEWRRETIERAGAKGHGH